MLQSWVVVAQRLHPLQLVQSLLLLDIVCAGVRIGGSCLSEPPLYGAVCSSSFWLRDGTEPAIEVGSEEEERRSTHTSSQWLAQEVAWYGKQLSWDGIRNVQ